MISSFIPVEASLLVTGSMDGTILIWQLDAASDAEPAPIHVPRTSGSPDVGVDLESESVGSGDIQCLRARCADPTMPASLIWRSERMARHCAVHQSISP